MIKLSLYLLEKTEVIFGTFFKITRGIFCQEFLQTDAFQHVFGEQRLAVVGQGAGGKSTADGFRVAIAVVDSDDLRSVDFFHTASFLGSMGGWADSFCWISPPFCIVITTPTLKKVGAVF